MGLNFGDLLSNALHEVKLHTRKKIGMIQDEIGYTFDPPLTGVTIESWRYRKPPSALPDLEQLATAIVAYGCQTHDRPWLDGFLKSGGHPFPDALCDQLFPAPSPQPPPLSQPNTETRPPLTDYRPPALDRFVGRESELTRFQNDLGENNLALICGMAGMGKTTLANQLAILQEDQNSIFWHPFHDGNLNPFIRRLAGFLANHGRSDLWEMIEAARTSGAKPPDSETSFDSLVAMLSGLPVTLCLDDLQYVDDDPQLVDFLTRIQQPSLKLIITARRFPSFLQTGQPELGGLSLADTADLLTGREVELDATLLTDLHTHTAGNGAFLTLAAVMLRHANDPADLIAKLATIDNIERFLMEEVNDRLSASQQRVMEGVAILSGYPGTRDVLEEMLNQRDVRRTLQELSGQFLLLTADGEFGRAYRQHAIVQAFYYEQPRQRVRRELHLRAAKFYEHEEVDRFKAAFHYGKGHNSERVIRLTAEYLMEIVNQGMARPLADVLDGITEDNLTQNDLFELWLAQAQLDTLLGDSENAQEVLQKAAERLQDLPKSAESDRLKARVCLHMAELLERQAPPDALAWAQRGLEVVPQGERELSAALTIRTGTMMMHMGNFGGALETFEVVADESLDGRPSLQADLWNNLSGAHLQTGNLDTAIDYAKQSIELSRSRRDHLQTCDTCSNLAYAYFLKGDWRKTVTILEEAMGIAKRLGSRSEMLALSINLGRFYTDLGDSERAWQHLSYAQKNCKSNSQLLAMTQINISRLLIADERFDEALEFLGTAEADAKAANDQLHLATAAMHQAEAELGLENVEQAAEKINRALSGFKQLGDEHGTGNALRISGEVLRRRSDLDGAEKALKQSFVLLENLDKYQAAISQTQLGRLQLEMGNFGEGHLLIGQAKAVFTDIGAIQKIESEKL